MTTNEIFIDGNQNIIIQNSSGNIRINTQDELELIDKISSLQDSFFSRLISFIENIEKEKLGVNLISILNKLESCAFAKESNLNKRVYLKFINKIQSSHLSLKYDPVNYISREIEIELHKWVNREKGFESHCFLILAPAGSGKTNLLCHFASEQVKERVTLFYAGAQLILDLQLGLWKNIAEDFEIDIRDIAYSRSLVIKKIINYISFLEFPVLIVIDAINEFHNSESLRREIKIFLEESFSSNILILFSCRDYYWGVFEGQWWEKYILIKKKSSISNKKNVKKLGNFTYEELTQAMKVYFSQYNIVVSPTGNAIEQFKHPLLLRFFCETYTQQHIGELKDIRLKELFDLYWIKKTRSISERMKEQGEKGVVAEIANIIQTSILSIAHFMLNENTRSISLSQAHLLTNSDEGTSFINKPYGRILDEHIILEEIKSNDKYLGSIKSVAFVFEEFMEYTMAKSLIKEWHNIEVPRIKDEVINLTKKYDDFNQVFGVILYLAIMLKTEYNIKLWSTLIGLGTKWEKLVIESFKKLPHNQIDDSVFDALIDLLSIDKIEIKIETLELLKYGRLKRIPTKPLLESIGELVTHDKIQVRRRVILALGYFPGEFSIPILVKGIFTYMHRVTDLYIVVKSTINSLARIKTEESIRSLCKVVICFGNSQYGIKYLITLLRNNLNEILKILRGNDFVSRVGAAFILCNSDFEKATPFLKSIRNEKFIAKEVEEFSKIEVFNWYYHNLFPGWNHVNWQEVTKEGNSIAAYIVNRFYEKHEENLERSRIDKICRNKIKEIINSGQIDEYPKEFDLIKSIYGNYKLIKLIIKSGLEFRSKKKWSIKKYSNSYAISPPKNRLVDGNISKEDEMLLKKFLKIDYTYNVSIRYYNRDYSEKKPEEWQIFMYKAWGFELE